MIDYILTLAVTYTAWIVGWGYFKYFGQYLVFLYPRLDFKPFNCLLCSQFWIMQGATMTATILFNAQFKVEPFIVSILLPFPFSLLTMLRDNH